MAIKVIRVGCDEPGLRRRFEEERHIFARLDHPNIARVFDGGSTTDGRAYLVMDLVDGEAIDVHCTAVQLTIEQRLRLFLDVCTAVELYWIVIDVEVAGGQKTAAGDPQRSAA